MTKAPNDHDDTPQESCQDGGEKDAGGRMLRILKTHCFTVVWGFPYLQ